MNGKIKFETRVKLLERPAPRRGLQQENVLALELDNDGPLFPGDKVRVTLELLPQAIKPCPFCGGDAEIKRVSEPLSRAAFYAVLCTVCGISTAHSSSEAHAVEAWNRRA